MTEREKWNLGVAAVREKYATLSPPIHARLKKCAAAIKTRKKALHEISAGVSSDEICAQCRGECCKSGKNHVTSIDLLVYLNDGKELFTPSFNQVICPYLGEHSCFMGPEYRPYNCVTFICERIEELLDPSEKERFYAVESELRALYRDMEQLFDKNIRNGVLNSCERQHHGQVGM
jgi:hypothetical protein